jgi:hypothetical protein
VLLYALRLWLLVCGGFGLGLGFRCGCFRGFLAFGFGVLFFLPVISNLELVSLAMQFSSSNLPTYSVGIFFVGKLAARNRHVYRFFVRGLLRLLVYIARRLATCDGGASARCEGELPRHAFKATHPTLKEP